MRDAFTSKQVARAIRVSESTVKRWCDKGTIPTQYTAGGHRRIPPSGLVHFLRTTQCQLARPDVLGLPSAIGQTPRGLDQARDQFVSALLDDDEPVCRRIALDIFLAEYSLSAICDDIFAPAFWEIGEGWACGDTEVYQERRACQMTQRLLNEFRSLLPAPPDSAPTAIGGSPPGDPYSLGTSMVELVLRDGRWNAVSLGENLPFNTMSAAILEHQPRLFWLSCSHIQNESAFLHGYQALFEEFGGSVAFVVGGQALKGNIRRGMSYAAFCDKLHHLERFAEILRDSNGTLKS